MIERKRMLPAGWFCVHDLLLFIAAQCRSPAVVLYLPRPGLCLP